MNACDQDHKFTRHYGFTIAGFYSRQESCKNALWGYERYWFETEKGVFSVLAKFGRWLEALWSPWDLSSEFGTAGREYKLTNSSHKSSTFVFLAMWPKKKRGGARGVGLSDFFPWSTRMGIVVHSGIGIQYDGEFGLALESKNHKTAWVVDGILVFRRILVKESVLFPTGLWYRPSSPGKGWAGRLGISAYTYLCFRYKHSLPGSPGGRFGYKTDEAKEEQIQKKALIHSWCSNDWKSRIDICWLVYQTCCIRHFTRNVILSLYSILFGIDDDCAGRRVGDRGQGLLKPSSRDSSLEPLGVEYG